MYKIQTLNAISPTGLGLLPKNDYEIMDSCEDPDGMILRSFKMHDMELPSSLQCVARAGAGTNNIPVDKCADAGIVVFNTPGANANGVKELVLTALLLSSRKIVEGAAHAKTYAGSSEDVEKLMEKAKSKFAGTEIQGKTLGLIGLGAIGGMVAESAIALGMKVIGYDPYISVDAAWKLPQGIVQATTVEALLKDSDYISLHMPLIDSTKGFMNTERFALCKKGVKVINFARGGIVNDDDMIEAVKSGQVSYYVSDFSNSKLLAQDNILCLPHLGASTEEAEENCAIMAVNQMREFLEKGNIVNSVNFPNCSMNRNPNTKRVTMANKNMPTIISQVTALFAKENLNICDMLNKSKGDLSYSIFDVEGNVSDEIVKQIEAIEGTLFVNIY